MNAFEFQLYGALAEMENRSNDAGEVTYTVTILASLSRQCLTDLLATPAEILSLTRDDGFATVLIRCDAATAATIAERYHISEV
jgi:hypothetical protein